MTDASAGHEDLLNRRLAVVGAVSALTAEGLRLRQKLAGAEMEVLRIELALGKAPSKENMVQDLHRARHSAEAIEAERTDCDERIAAMEAEIAGLDGALAAMGRVDGEDA